MTYSNPFPADLKLRYPAFAGVNEDTIQYWLTDAERYADASWPFEGDYAPALIAVAAHRMTIAKVAGLAADEISALSGSGLTSFKSGTFSASFSDAAATLAAEGGWDSTAYGREYAELLHKNKGGPRVTGPGTLLCNVGYNGFAGQLPGWMA